MRPALVIGIGLAIFQQVTGINTVIYYAPVIVQSAGISSASGAILATAGIGLVNVIMTIVAMWLIDHVGRRPLLLTGIAGMILSLAVLGFVFRMPTGGALAWLAVITLMVYVASFAISLGPIFWLLIAEIYPLKVRGIAEGTAAGVNWAFNFLVSLTFLTLIQILGAELHVLDVCGPGHRLLVLLLLSGPRNQRPHPGRDRAVLPPPPRRLTCFVSK